ncbi:HNH endonuclease [Chryseobacterium cheonjiense]|uniref:HNH endonuclease n=1 Tax=Chryseobacterium cheonjiense TaxID=2728845 RepID=A0A7Y0FH41_9FLAO|nr:HNH endonuclease signature motif containing protein [Chryseobacterium cheonjiense]NML55826.1 HNH endonuclease [Chryseobacterium cheonjiense]
MKNNYNSEFWKEFRDSIIESDGYKCSICGKESSKTILQVHHTKYIKGRNLWEYASEDCVTLCKSCHAMEHGKIKPNYGWEYIGDEDLGDLIGECDNCGSNIRYVFHIYHEKWGALEVGTLCCDNLTDSQEASNLMESVRRFESRKKNFINSIKWKSSEHFHSIKKNLFEIKIDEIDDYFCLTIHNQKSKKRYSSLELAKSSAFEAIENGKFIEYCLKKNISLPAKFKINNKQKDK